MPKHSSSSSTVRRMTSYAGLRAVKTAHTIILQALFGETLPKRVQRMWPLRRLPVHHYLSEGDRHWPLKQLGLTMEILPMLQARQPRLLQILRRYQAGLCFFDRPPVRLWCKDCWSSFASSRAGVCGKCSPQYVEVLQERDRRA